MKIAFTAITFQNETHLTVKRGKTTATLSGIAFLQYATTDPHLNGDSFVAFDGVDAQTGEELDVIIHDQGLTIQKGEVKLEIGKDTMTRAVRKMQNCLARPEPPALTID